MFQSLGFYGVSTHVNFLQSTMPLVSIPDRDFMMFQRGLFIFSKPPDSLVSIPDRDFMMFQLQAIQDMAKEIIGFNP